MMNVEEDSFQIQNISHRSTLLYIHFFGFNFWIEWMLYRRSLGRLVRVHVIVMADVDAGAGDALKEFYTHVKEATRDAEVERYECLEEKCFVVDDGVGLLQTSSHWWTRRYVFVPRMMVQMADKTCSFIISKRKEFLLLFV